MTDRGMIFAASSVLAMLDGRKTMTRRLLKPQPPAIVTSAGVISRSTEGHTDEWSWLSGDPRDCDTWGYEGDFHTGFVPGDRRWVKERHYVQSAGYADGTGRLIIYEADGEAPFTFTSSRHMPKLASRLTLIVEAVKVERLQEISEADAIAEGVFKKMWEVEEGLDMEIVDGWSSDRFHAFKHGVGETAREGYAILWNSLHTKPSERWEDNPWVVVVSFSVVRGNIDQVPA